ncbi:unnamed protein product [Vicia faba]|uniref:DUF1664 domain-containing protein n=1 Tax=Vicia faba TaxID=3906 RepID=A0AAV0ZJ61_VICFA|nr:unnamed protein product [Vicia faba]
MALQMAPSSSKVLILVGAGLASSVVLNGGPLSAVIAQLQEVLKGVDDQVKISTAGYDTAVIAAQVRQLAQEIRELTLSRPMTIYNESSSRGGLASYLLPAAAIGAVGYCYMRWKDLSFSDVMFATKKNMANAVASVSKQLENVHETLASTKRHLTKRLEGLDLKVEEQNELGKHISNDEMGGKECNVAEGGRLANCVTHVIRVETERGRIVEDFWLETILFGLERESSLLREEHSSGHKHMGAYTSSNGHGISWFCGPGCLESIDVVNAVKSDLSQIGCDVEFIHQMMSGLEEKLKLVEGNQDVTNSGILYLCKLADDLNNEPNGRVYKGLAELTMTLEEKTPKGLQFIAETPDTIENSAIITKKVGLNFSDEKLSVSKSRVHRAYPVGISVSKGISDLV